MFKYINQKFLCIGVLLLPFLALAEPRKAHHDKFHPKKLHVNGFLENIFNLESVINLTGELHLTYALCQHLCSEQVYTKNRYKSTSFKTGRAYLAPGIGIRYPKKNIIKVRSENLTGTLSARLLPVPLFIVYNDPGFLDNLGRTTFYLGIGMHYLLGASFEKDIQSGEAQPITIQRFYWSFFLGSGWDLGDFYLECMLHCPLGYKGTDKLDPVKHCEDMIKESTFGGSIRMGWNLIPLFNNLQHTYKRKHANKPA